MPAQGPHSWWFFLGGRYLFTGFQKCLDNVFRYRVGSLRCLVKGQELASENPYGPLANQDIVGYYGKSLGALPPADLNWYFFLFLLPALDTQQFTSANLSCGSCLLEQLCSQIRACLFIKSLSHPLCPQKESRPFPGHLMEAVLTTLLE